MTNRDPLFLSCFWKQLMQCSGTKLQHSTPYHPESDGQSEVVNICLEQYLRCFVHDQPHQWYNFLPWAEFWYNSSFHTAIKMSSYHALYGVNPSHVPVYSPRDSSVDSVDD